MISNLNTPAWGPHNPKARGAFQEIWYLKLNDPANQRALWLRFTLLVSANGFRQIAETWAVFFQRNAAKEVTKVAVKQTHDLKAFSASKSGGIRIGECEFSQDRTRGQIQYQGKSMIWDLRLTPTPTPTGPSQQNTFNLIPEVLQRTGITQSSAVTVNEELRFNGETIIDGQRSEWNDAVGMQGHFSGTKAADSWIWGHCNLFVDEQGRPTPFIFEGISAKERLIGSIPSPRLSTFYFHYKGKPYAFNSLWDSMRVKSHHSLTQWDFQADRGELSFRGQAKAELKDFVGLTYEDTNGSLLYCANSKLSDLQVHVYRRGKLENAFYSPGTAALEVVTRQKNPYVPILV